MNLITMTPPAEMLVSLQEAKDHLRVVSAAEDGHVRRLVKSATAWAESFLNRTLVERTMKMVRDDLPSVFLLPAPPAKSVSEITYYDGDNVEQTLATDQYDLVPDSVGASVTTAYNVTFPSVYPRADAVSVTYVAGYGAPADVPEDIKHGVLIALSDFYEHRESEIVGVMVMKMPITTAQKILWPHRVMF